MKNTEMIIKDNLYGRTQYIWEKVADFLRRRLFPYIGIDKELLGPKARYGQMLQPSRASPMGTYSLVQISIAIT